MTEVRPAMGAPDRTQRRIVGVLALATVLGGLGVGASLSAGALLIVDVTGVESLSGFGSTMNALGAALAGIPLARLAARRGRRIALSTGSAIAVLGAILIIAASATRTPVALFIGLAVLGVAVAVQLQSRFAATDLATPARRARDLSLVVWSITIGAVTGPNLIGPGEVIGESLGIPPLAGIFVFTVAAQAAAGLVVWIGLRPDPLLEARAIAAAPKPAGAGPDADPAAGIRSASATPQFLAMAVVALGHAVMVALMAMTPLHLMHHGGSVTLVGFTISMHIAGMYALSPVFGVLTSRIGPLPVLLGGFAALTLAALGTGFGGDKVWVIQVALILLGIGWSMVTISGASLLTSLAPADVRPKRQGQSDTMMNAAGATVGALSGLVFATGGFPLLSSVMGACIVLGALATVRLAVAARR